MTMISWAFLLAALAVVVLFLLRVFPIYLQDFAVGSAVRSLKEDTLATYSTPSQLQTALLRRFSMNDVTNATRDDVEITQRSGMFDVNVNYEVRTAFMFNIDLVLSFEHDVQVPVH
ncbi:MAG: DUF4845 domain-containing protein [Gammaproteobacteria bacterium]|nr:DUF4845 domain-containing protein [Gammaproteobacteria bacterium]